MPENYKTAAELFNAQLLMHEQNIWHFTYILKLILVQDFFFHFDYEN